MIAAKNILQQRPGCAGFTLIELMVVVAVICILAMLAIPSNLVHYQRQDVAEALKMTDKMLVDISYYYVINQSFPANNKEAGLPEPEFLIGNKVTRVDIEDGVVHITLGNKANKSLAGKILSLHPAVVIDSPTSPISWLCGKEEPVTGMEVVGVDKTDVARVTIPKSCGTYK